MTRMRPRFWELPLAELGAEEWEALCDGCGKCCLIKLEDAETGEIRHTRVACRLLDGETCRCGNYRLRHHLVRGCVRLSPAIMDEAAAWLPASCAYRLRREGRALPAWHHLICGDPEAVHRAGRSVRGRILPEWEVPEEELEDHVIADP
ncbi:MAG: UPF0260 protein [Paracoccaceae bacterium]|nr:MAG: UPF0260 protein [Paracoccaceae bacterium]